MNKYFFSFDYIVPGDLHKSKFCWGTSEFDLSRCLRTQMLEQLPAEYQTAEDIKVTAFNRV